METYKIIGIISLGIAGWELAAYMYIPEKAKTLSWEIKIAMAKENWKKDSIIYQSYRWIKVKIQFAKVYYADLASKNEFHPWLELRAIDMDDMTKKEQIRYQRYINKVRQKKHYSN